MITWCVTVPLFWAIIECFDGRCPGTYFVERGGEWDFFVCFHLLYYLFVDVCFCICVKLCVFFVCVC